MIDRNAPAPARIETAVAAHHEPAPRTGPATLSEREARLIADPTDDPEYRYKRLLYHLAVGPGFEDAASVPDYDPARRWVLVQVSENSGHAWVSLHESGPAAAQALADDVDAGLVTLDKEESFLYSLDNGSRWQPSVYTRVVWQ